MALTTDLAIANQALGRLGVATIASLTAGDYTGVDQDSYDLVVQSLMERHEWKWLHTFAQLTAATTPAGQWSYAYDLPPDLVGASVTAVYPTSGVGVRPTTEWKRVGSEIWTDHSTLFAFYKQDKPPSSWPPSFKLLAIEALAEFWAMPVTEDQDKASAMRQAAYGGLNDDGRGGRFREAVNADTWSDPSFSLLDVFDPIADTRYGDTFSIGRVR